MSNEIKAAIAISGIVMVGISYIFTENKRSEVKKEEAKRDALRIKASLPPEYWAAKEAQTNAELEENKIKLENEKQLELDKRDRADREAEKIRVYEQHAPEAYWHQRQIEEEEKTKREKLKLEDERYRRMQDNEREIAKRNAKAIEESAKTIERAVRSNMINIPY